MNPRTTGILFLVALLLGAFIYFYEIRGGERRQEAEAEAKRLFAGLETDVLRRCICYFQVPTPWHRNQALKALLYL